MATPLELLTIQLTQIDEMLNSGVTRASYGGKSVEYRSLDDMIRIRRGLQSQIDSINAVPGRSRRLLVKTQKGY